MQYTFFKIIYFECIACVSPVMCSDAFLKKEKPASGPETLWLLHSSCFRPVCLCFRFLGSSLCHRACPETHQKNQVLQKKKETQVGLNTQRGRKRWERGQAECWILNEFNQPQELFITYIYLTLGEERQNQPWHKPPTAIDFDSVSVWCVLYTKRNRFHEVSLLPHKNWKENI